MPLPYGYSLCCLGSVAPSRCCMIFPVPWHSVWGLDPLVNQRVRKGWGVSLKICPFQVPIPFSNTVCMVVWLSPLGRLPWLLSASAILSLWPRPLLICAVAEVRTWCKNLSTLRPHGAFLCCAQGLLCFSLLGRLSSAPSHCSLSHILQIASRLLTMSCLDSVHTMEIVRLLFFFRIMARKKVDAKLPCPLQTLSFACFGDFCFVSVFQSLLNTKI